MNQYPFIVSCARTHKHKSIFACYCVLEEKPLKNVCMSQPPCTHTHNICAQGRKIAARHTAHHVTLFPHGLDFFFNSIFPLLRKEGLWCARLTCIRRCLFVESFKIRYDSPGDIPESDYYICDTNLQSVHCTQTIFINLEISLFFIKL